MGDLWKEVAEIQENYKHLNIGEFFDILLTHPEWDTYIRGRYTNNPELELVECITFYDFVSESFATVSSITSEVPTDYYVLPVNKYESIS